MRDLKRAIEKAAAERDALSRSGNAAFSDAAADGDRIEAALALAREQAERAETLRVDVAAAEARTRATARAAEDALAEAAVELRALSRLTAQARPSDGATLLDHISAKAGFELALAAALGEDVGASLDPTASMFWSGPNGRSRAPKWPAGVTPLADVVTAPARLAARLAFTGLVAAADGDALQPDLSPTALDWSRWRAASGGGTALSRARARHHPSPCDCGRRRGSRN